MLLIFLITWHTQIDVLCVLLARFDWVRTGLQESISKIWENIIKWTMKYSSDVIIWALQKCFCMTVNWELGCDYNTFFYGISTMLFEPRLFTWSRISAIIRINIIIHMMRVFINYVKIRKHNKKMLLSGIVLYPLWWCIPNLY